MLLLHPEEIVRRNAKRVGDSLSSRRLLRYIPQPHQADGVRRHAVKLKYHVPAQTVLLLCYRFNPSPQRADTIWFSHLTNPVNVITSIIPPLAFSCKCGYNTIGVGDIGEDTRYYKLRGEDDAEDNLD